MPAAAADRPRRRSTARPCLFQVAVPVVAVVVASLCGPLMVWVVLSHLADVTVAAFAFALAWLNWAGDRGWRDLDRFMAAAAAGPAGDDLLR